MHKSKFKSVWGWTESTPNISPHQLIPQLSPGGVLETTEECIQLPWFRRAAWQGESAQQALSTSAAQRQELLFLGAMERQLEEHQLSPGLWTA